MRQPLRRGPAAHTRPVVNTDLTRFFASSDHQTAFSFADTRAANSGVTPTLATLGHTSTGILPCSRLPKEIHRIGSEDCGEGPIVADVRD
jgi:hypothetical protein